MAQKTIVELLDDLDGGEADETVLFGLDGVDLEIDLSEAHAAELREALARYVAVARRVKRDGTVTRLRRGGGANGNGAGRGRMSRTESQKVREWGRAQGYEVSERGRIPDDLVTAYQQQVTT